MKRTASHAATAALALALLVATAGAGAANGKHEPSRGEMLYNTHCIACHTEQVHWREQSLARDWGSLTHQVRRWQANTGLHWEEQDIRAVARYLNQLYYHFPASEAGTLSEQSGSGER